MSDVELAIEPNLYCAFSNMAPRRIFVIAGTDSSGGAYAYIPFASQFTTSQLIATMQGPRS